MPRIPQNLCKRVIGMLNACMTMNAVAMNIGCSNCAIRHHRQHFQATGRTEDRLRNGHPLVMTRGQGRYIRKTHQHDRFKTATDTAVNTHGTHNNSISAHTVRNGLHEDGLSARRPYVHMLVVFWRDVTA